jgi:hypothetical protein
VAIWFAGFFQVSCHCRSPAEAAAEQRKRDVDALPPTVGGLTEMLEAERSHRPTQGVTPTLESIIASTGLPFDAPTQTLGRTVLALHCSTANSSAGLTLMVCEFPGVEQAKRGLTEITALRGKMMGWQAHVSKQSTLELVVRPDASKETVERVLKAFNAP